MSRLGWKKKSIAYENSKLKADAHQVEPLMTQLQDELANLKTSTGNVLSAEVEKRTLIESEVADLKTSTEEALSVEVKRIRLVESELPGTKSKLGQIELFGQHRIQIPQV